MRRLLRPGILLSLAPCLAACGDQEALARKLLEDDGCSNIKLTPQSDKGSFAFEAECEQKQCKGTITIQGSQSSYTSQKLKTCE